MQGSGLQKASEVMVSPHNPEKARKIYYSIWTPRFDTPLAFLAVLALH